MIRYTTEDYKKYIYALGMHRVRRLYDSVGGLDLGLDISDDITCSLDQLENVAIPCRVRRRRRCL